MKPPIVGVPFLRQMALRAVGADRLALALLRFAARRSCCGPNMKLNSSAVTTAPPVRNVM